MFDGKNIPPLQMEPIKEEKEESDISS